MKYLARGPLKLVESNPSELDWGEEAKLNPTHLKQAIETFHKNFPNENVEKRALGFRHLPNSEQAKDLLMYHYFDDKGNFLTDQKSRPRNVDLSKRLMDQDRRQSAGRGAVQYNHAGSAGNAVRHLHKAFNQSLEGNKDIEPHRNTIISKVQQMRPNNITPESIEKRKATLVAKRVKKMDIDSKVIPKHLLQPSTVTSTSGGYSVSIPDSLVPRIHTPATDPSHPAARRKDSEA